MQIAQINAENRLNVLRQSARTIFTDKKRYKNEKSNHN